jgi:hypothetical protein
VSRIRKDPGTRLARTVEPADTVIEFRSVDATSFVTPLFERVMMRKAISAAALAMIGLASTLGARADGEGKKIFFVYSADERGEIQPCG